MLVVRGRVHGVDGRGAAAAAGVPPVPGRQAAGGVRAGGQSAARAVGRARRRQRSAENRRRARCAGACAPLGRDGALPFELTNLKKVFWPDDGYTKGDLIEYYRASSPWLLPYLRDRPLVMTRYPDGIAGKSFFQKDAPGFAPGLDPHRADLERGHPARDRLLRLRRRGLAALRRQPRHDPAPHLGQPRADARAAGLVRARPRSQGRAVRARGRGRAGGARSCATGSSCRVYVKTSGSTGLHLLIPLGRQCTYEQSRSLGELLARCLVGRLPEIATIVRQVSQRRRARSTSTTSRTAPASCIVAPFSVRPLPGAPVSMPLTWREVNQRARHPAAHHQDGAGADAEAQGAIRWRRCSS